MLAQLMLWDDRFIWVSHSFMGQQMTRRYATNIMLAITNKPLLLILPDGSTETCHAALCSSRAVRCVDATDTPFLSLNLDPDCPAARMLESKVAGQEILQLERHCFAHLDIKLMSLLAGELSCAATRVLSDELITAILGEIAIIDTIDPRIRKVADHIRANQLTDIDTSALASMVNLSPTRLVHLFSQQIGLPMTQFLLWIKMRHAVELVQQGVSLTHIAQICGFSDLAHLTRTFKAFYGIKPSELANSRYVQSSLCNTR